MHLRQKNNACCILYTNIVYNYLYLFNAFGSYSVDNDIYDELPSKSANLLPEYTNPAWMLEQVSWFQFIIGWEIKLSIGKQKIEDMKCEYL